MIHVSKALAALLLAALAACGGGGSDEEPEAQAPEVKTPKVDCVAHPELCKV